MKMKTDRLAEFKNWILISSDIKYVESQAVQGSQKKLLFIYQEEQEEASTFYFQCCSEVLPSPKEAM